MQNQEFLDLSAREKQLAAMASVVAAIVLTLLKLSIGLFTNSLGILAEAAHSGLDLLAAAVTLFAVRFSSQPPDRRHPYGHGKIENLSALIEGVLLLVTCVWIVHEAASRLFFHEAPMRPSIWGVVIMVISICVDWSRSRMLLRVARKHKSQALEADALHFSTDIWSSLVVIVGLLAIKAATFLPSASVLAPWLLRADSLAAVAVSLIIAHVSIRICRQAVDVLLDGGSEAEAARITELVGAIPGVTRVERVRTRRSGPSFFVDLQIEMSDAVSFEQAHFISANAEQAVHAVLPGADVVVHFEPQKGTANLPERIRRVAALQRLDVHGIQIYSIRKKIHVELHVEVPGNYSLAQAHGMTTEFERKLRESIGNIASVMTHIEPQGGIAHGIEPVRDQEVVLRSIEHVAGLTREVRDVHNVIVNRVGDLIAVSFHCRMAEGTPVIQAHDVTRRLESDLRMALPSLGRITIHLEPLEGS